MAPLRSFFLSKTAWVVTSVIAAGVLGSACTDPSPSRQDIDTELPTNGKIAFARDPGKHSAIYTMGANGSNQTLIGHTRGAADPSWSPDGRMILFARGPKSGYVAGIFVINADGSDLRRITRNKETADTFARWSPDGKRITFARGLFTEFGPDAFDVYVMYSDGNQLRNLTDHPANDSHPSWSPNGTRIAFSSDRSGYSNIWAIDLVDGTLTRLTDHEFHDTLPVWSPDGDSIAFVSNRDGNTEIYRMNADGTGQRNLTNNEADDIYPTWSPDGTKIAFVSTRDGNDEIFTMDTDGKNVRNLTKHPSDYSEVSWQPVPK